MTQQRGGTGREPLNRARVLHAAVALADGSGAEALSMRRLAQELGVVPMALYKHVANKEELLDGMVDAVVTEAMLGGAAIGETTMGETTVDGGGAGDGSEAAVGGGTVGDEVVVLGGAAIGEPEPSGAEPDWKTAVRHRILAARRALLRHRWAAHVIESRPAPTPAVLAHLDAVIGTFRAGGLSADLTHHAMHALGTRLLGISRELFDTGGATSTGDDSAPASDAAPADPAVGDAGRRDAAAAAAYPNVAEIAAAAAHDTGSVVGGGCDDQFEFEFALDLLLDGIERLHRQGWTSASARASGRTSAHAGARTPG